MRIAVITESFPPDVNGVAHTVLRVAEHLARRGHHPLVIAPGSARSAPGSAGAPAGLACLVGGPARAAPAAGALCPVVRVPSMPLPGYPAVRVGLPVRKVRHALAAHRPDIVHLASPAALGGYGSAVARSMGLPMVAVYQTDLPGYARAYRFGAAGEAFAWRLLRSIHNRAGRTLAPSSAAAAALREHGIERVWLWGRGIDTDQFHPSRRSASLRARLAPGGEVLAGYVGRLAAEKRVDLLAPVAALPGVRLVIVGGGPATGELRAAMPSAIFLGEQHGTSLAATYASMDIFIHSGPYETFGQTLQEAAASGLPVVAPAAGGPLDLVADGVTGFLVPPGDGEALAAPVARLAADPVLRAAQGKAARQRVLGRSWSALGDDLIGHYAAVLEPDVVQVAA